MADYHAVLKRAIDALPENTGSARRAVYQRARTAIVNQLKSYDPPLSPSDITTEQLHLEEAIRKVEADAARQTLGLGPQQPSRPPAETRPAASDSQNGAGSRGSSPQGTASQGAASLGSASQGPGAHGSAPAVAAPQASPSDAPKFAAPKSEAPQVDSVQRGGAAPESAEASAPKAPPVTGSREAEISSAKGAEPATTTKPPEEPAKAKGGFFSRLKSKTPDKTSGDANNGGSEPELGDGTTAKPDPAAPKPAPMSGPTLSSPRAGRPAGEASGTETTPGAAILAKDPAAPAMQRSSKALDAAMRANRDTVARPTKLPAIAAIIAALIIFGGLAAGVYSQRDAILAMIESIGSDVATAPDESVEVPQETPVAGVPGNGRQPKSDERLLSDDGSAAAPDARAVTTTRITPPSDAEGGVTSAAPSGNGARVVTPEAQPEAEAEAPQSETAQSGAPESAETPLAALPSIPGAEPPGQKEEGLQIAQRSILYEEGEGADASGSASQGQVVWSTLQEAAPGTEIIDTVLKANVVIPDRDITVNVTIRPNRDESLPASHLIEIRFTLPKEFEGKGVANVPGLIMKTTEEARGDALVGASVRVDSGFFWVALSSLEAEKQRNETLLRDRGWIDIPILYDSGKRAILTLEKGTAGDRAVQLALDAWTGG